jgi:hypothetical protein
MKSKIARKFSVIAAPCALMIISVFLPSYSGATQSSEFQDSISSEELNAEAISKVADSIAAQTDGNFVDIHTDAINNLITVYWAGNPPRSVVEFGISRPLGVTVKFDTSSKISRLEADLRIGKLIEYGNQNGWEIQTVMPTIENDSIEIVVGPKSKLTDDHLVKIQDLSALTNVTIKRSGVESNELLLAGRLNDSAPFKGGARTLQGSQGCTTGFAVLSGTSGRLLSSRHCDPSSNAAITNGNSSVVITTGGTGVSGKASLDSQLIDPSASPATIARIYTGNWSSSNYQTVKNWYSNWVGDSVCLSGATSGQRCGRVTNDSVTWVHGDYNINTILVTGTSGAILAASGDSGGPAYSQLSNGVQARGIISAVYSGSPHYTDCSDFALNPDIALPICSRYVLYVPISTLLNAWNLSLEVG